MSGEHTPTRRELLTWHRRAITLHAKAEGLFYDIATATHEEHPLADEADAVVVKVGDLLGAIERRRAAIQKARG